MKAVKFDRYGGIDVLRVVETARPVPGNGQALVRVKAAGINPGEGAIREGKLAAQWPSTFPSGQGSDLAGIIEELGSELPGFAVGDEVIGFTNNRASQAEFVVVEMDHIVHRPASVSWEQAGALFVAGTTAYAVVKAVSVEKGDTVIVSGAAGGVGSLAVQLARNTGAKVIGLASEPNHEWLTAHGAIPITYGAGMAERIRAIPGGHANAFIDTHGDGYVKLAIEFGIAPGRINTIIDFAAAKKYGVKTVGNSEGATAEVLEKLAAMISNGKLEIPIAGVYHFADVREAYMELEKRHTHGKIVLVP